MSPTNSAANQIRPLDHEHDRAAFSCNDPRLDDYLKQHARNAMERSLAVVWVWTRPPSQTVIGYYTLTNTEVEVGILPERIRKKVRSQRIGSTLLGKFAIASEFQGQGNGEALCMRALRDALQASKTVASVGVYLEARTEAARRFWAKCEFTSLGEREDGVERFFMPMSHIEDLQAEP